MRLIKQIEHIKQNTLRNLLYIVSVLFILMNTEIGQAQQIQFSQFYSSPMFLSPSYAGMIPGGRAVLNYRKQWPGIPGAFDTYAFTYDQYLPRINSGLGIAFFRDQAGSGSLSLTEVGLQYSFDKAIGRGRNPVHIRPGMFFKYAQRTIDVQKLTFSDQLVLEGNNIPQSIETGYVENTGYIDFSASVIAYDRRYWGGITVDHLLRPNESLYSEEAIVPIKISAFAGILFPIDKKKFRRKGARDFENITASFLYRASGGSDQLDIGAYWNNPPLTLGLWFRGLPVINQSEGAYEKIDALIILIGYKIGDMKFGYSYDLTISKLIGSTGGSHEFSMVYEFAPPKGSANKRYASIPCPSF